ARPACTRAVRRPGFMGARHIGRGATGSRGASAGNAAAALGPSEGAWRREPGPEAVRGAVLEQRPATAWIRGDADGARAGEQPADRTDRGGNRRSRASEARARDRTGGTRAVVSPSLSAGDGPRIPRVL